VRHPHPCRTGCRSPHPPRIQTVPGSLSTSRLRHAILRATRLYPVPNRSGSEQRLPAYLHHRPPTAAQLCGKDARASRVTLRRSPRRQLTAGRPHGSQRDGWYWEDRARPSTMPR
jgi:hypothetical protein